MGETDHKSFAEVLDAGLIAPGTAVGSTGPDGKPHLDPRLFDSPAYAHNPHPYFAIMREHYPVYFDKLHNAYYLTRYDDVAQACFDDEGFATLPKGIASTVLGNTQLELGGVEHRRRRNLYGQHLVGRSLMNRLPSIERLAEEMIDDWDNLGAPAVVDAGRTRTVELGKAFANEFPVRVICDVLGFPQSARQDFYYWYNSMMSGFGGSDTHEQGLRARQDLEDFVEGLVQKRRVEPTYLRDNDGNIVSKDLISKLCETRIDSDYLSTEEITSNIALLVGGGGETTRGAIMNMWYLLLQNPAQLDAIHADDTLWDAAFHETLRMAIPTGGLQPRAVTRDIEMHGVTIPAGSLVHLVNHAANRDPRVYDDPDQFNIFRGDLYSGKLIRSGYRLDGRSSHMSFGVGPHMCPGAWISHQEGVIGSKILMRRLKNPRLCASRTPRDENGTGFAPIGLNALGELWIDIDR